MKRVVFHIDVNSAFVSWSAVKILSEVGNDIRLVTSVVSDDPNDRRCTFASQTLPDRTDCFEVKDSEGKVIEPHQVK